MEWFGQNHFPGGLVLIGVTDEDRMKTIMRAMDEFKYNIVLALGTDRDDAARFKRLGITQVILSEDEPDFAAVKKFIAGSPWEDLPQREVELIRCAGCGGEHTAEPFIRIDFYRDKKRRGKAEV